MKKFLLLFIGCIICMTEFSVYAVTINKASPVAVKETSSSATVNSLVPTVFNLISNVQALSAKQKALTAECIPSSQEINFVDNIMKEWAKTGVMTVKDVENKLGYKQCTSAEGYSNAVQMAQSTDMDELLCFNYFAGSGNEGMVWEGFPKVGVATYCSDGSPAGMCSNKDKVTVSNIYDIFNLVDFSIEDYTEAEGTMATKLISKIEQCSYSKLSAKKRAMWGEFLLDTIGSLGQSTNTGSIMETVSAITSGGLGSSLGSISSLATSLLGN